MEAKDNHSRRAEMTTANLPPQHLFAITVGVNDVARQKAFYEAWGWQASPISSAEYAAFDMGGPIVSFFSRHSLAEEAAPGETGPANGWNGTTLAVSVAERDAVDEVWKAAIAAGARDVTPPVDRPWGGRSGYVADPEGVRWEILWFPPMPGGSQ
jgi:uncharacterized glyoxalase superfamily protein PhnB